MSTASSRARRPRTAARRTARVPLSVVLLGAGYGTRLYPLTKHRPKALLPIGSETIIDPLIDGARALPKLSRLVLVTNARFFGLFDAWRRRRGVDLEIVNDGSRGPQQRLGAIQDLQLCLARIDPADDVLVLGTDNLFTWPLARFVEFAASKRPAPSMAVQEAPSLAEARHYGVVELDARHRIIRLTEKPQRPASRRIASCVYYLPARCRRRVGEFIRSGGSSDAPGYFMAWLVRQEPVYGCLLCGKWFDIGTPDSYKQAAAMWVARRPTA